MKKILIVFLLVSQSSCIYRVGPFVRDARMESGELEIERCEIVYEAVFGGVLRESCTEGTRRR